MSRLVELAVTSALVVAAVCATLLNAPSVSSQTILFEVPEAMPTYAEYEMWNLDAEMTSGPIVLDSAELTAWFRAAVKWNGSDWKESIRDSSNTASVRPGDTREASQGVARMVSGGQVVYETEEDPSNQSVPVPPFALAFYEGLKLKVDAGLAEPIAGLFPCGTATCGRLDERVAFDASEETGDLLASLPWDSDENVQIDEILFDAESMLVREHIVRLNGKTTFRFKLNCFSFEPGAQSC